ncbi:hypothetical protein [Prochlorococcus marinus]|uniref:hypothetical protein n=1 Tax=Prochlorococcus TaxID=1218 RepID=UPI001F36EE76|nr:hypothetical protein [Prochlorococcus marinus]
MDGISTYGMIEREETGKVNKNNFAALMRRMQNFNAAEYFIKRYQEIEPDCISGKNTYGTILSDLGKNGQAI